MFGCAGEMAGYIGRIMMHSNPWSNSGFELQICTLIFSPVSVLSVFEHCQTPLMLYSPSLPPVFTSHSST